MAIKSKISSAWEDITTLNVKVNNASQEADHANALVNGAWQIVWRAIQMMVTKTINIKNGWSFIRDGGLTYYYNKYEDEGGNDGDISGTGEIVMYVDGEWTNPQISFDWEGGGYRSNASMTAWYTMRVGNISIYYRKSDGTEDTLTVVANMGRSTSGDDSLDTSNEKGSYSGVLEGTYNRLGISIEPTGYSSAAGYWNANMDIYVKNLKFNKQKIGFPDSAEFDYT